ncbi:MAG: radical SAM protein [Thermoplasmatales archaeon]|nr:radical SAM protein [Thermoplasmatales archaeon]
MIKLGTPTKRFITNFVYNKLARKHYPFFGSLEVTRKCNSKCIFCPIGNEKAGIKKGEVGTAAMKKVLDQFAELNILAVSFLGGEPFLRKDVCELAEHAGELGIITQVSTNGINLIDNVERATSAFDVIVVSLDTIDPEMYKYLRGVDKFDKVLEGIKAAQALSQENKCNILINTVVCSKNIQEIPEVVKFSMKLGVRGIMIDFATFHDCWLETVNENSRYNPKELDWRNDKKGTKQLVRNLIEMKKKYPILTSRSYLQTFLTEDFNFKCYPYLFCCVRKEGEVAIPCWDSKFTKYYDIIDSYRLKELWFSDEAKVLRKKVENCSECYMHCIVEPSKVLGATTRNLKDLMEWVATFQRSRVQ